jgi:hypothetical protein
LKSVWAHAGAVSRELTRRRALAGGAAALLASLAGCSGATPFVGKRTERTETVSVGDAERLSVRSAVGDVTLRATDRDDLDVHVVKQSSAVTADLSDLSFLVERDGGDLVLRSEWRGDGRLLGGRPSMDLDVALPRSFPVGLVESAVGDVTLDGVAGDVDVESETGDVRARGVAGSVRAVTSTGDVQVDAPERLRDVRTETGDVTVDVPALDGDTVVRAETGDVDAAVAPDLDADLRARTDTGDVSVTGLSLSDATREERVVVGTLGAGGPTLEFGTQTGDVTITTTD